MHRVGLVRSLLAPSPPPGGVDDDIGGLPWQLSHLNLLEAFRASLPAQLQLEGPLFVPYRLFVEPDMAVLACSDKHQSPLSFQGAHAHYITILGFVPQSMPRWMSAGKSRLPGMPSPRALCRMCCHVCSGVANQGAAMSYLPPSTLAVY